MPAGLVQALTAPLVELRTLVGSGDVAAADEAAELLRRAGLVLDEVAAVGAGADARLGEAWSGAAAEAAARSATATGDAVRAAASCSAAIAARIQAAARTVVSARAELQRIVDDFAATAHRLEQDLPHTTRELVAAARRALDEAVAVLTKAQAELDEHTDAVHSSAVDRPSVRPAAASTPQPASVPSAAFSPAPMAGSPAMFSAGTPASPAGFSGPQSGTSWPEPASPAGHMMPDPETFGSGVAIRLPDGSTAMAPNRVAADAVHYALTQLGVPYRWGGTTPGVGLDCSGLTQWAYRSAGLQLPRLAQEQDVGAMVPAGDVLPGDLAVWDGHVAMVVGNGMMIEAGDPVQLSPIRITNAGQGFQGFWRPTA